MKGSNQPVTGGRAARNINAYVLLYADQITGSIDRAMKEIAPPAPSAD